MSDLPGWVPSERERTGRGPTARKAWGALGSALGGAFFIGAIVSGFAEDRIIAVIIGGPIFLLASVGLLLAIGQRVRVGIASRFVLFALSAAAGFELSQALSYDVTGPPPQDLGKAVSSIHGIVGFAALVLAAAVATWFSVHRFPLAGEPAAGTTATQ